MCRPYVLNINILLLLLLILSKAILVCHVIFAPPLFRLATIITISSSSPAKSRDTPTTYGVF